MSKQFIAILIVIIGGLFAILAFTNKGDNGGSGSSNAQPSSHITGKVDSKVNMTEFLDFECPACKAYFPIVQQIKAEYGDRVAFQYRHFPLTSIHPNALIASRAAEAAGKQGKFFEMHDLLFQNQDSWKSLTNPTSVFEGFASQLSLNVEQFKTDMTSAEVLGIIDADRQLAQDLGASSTPTFVVNGQKLDQNPTDIESFRTILDEALKNAESSSTPN